MKTILDMDPGIDDAVALLIALNSSKLDILGITTVSGNVDVNKATYNVLRLLSAAGKKITVASGAQRPLFKRPIHAEHIHGSDGLGNSDLQARKLHVLDAQKFFTDVLSSSKKKEISVVATGPLTNIALFLDKDPSLVHKLDRIVLMGGVYGMAKNIRGNVSPNAEFNVYCDPEAASIVFNSGAKIDAVGLDVTMTLECAIDIISLNAISKIRGKGAKIAGKILSYPVSKYRIFHLHDVFALACLLKPSIFKTINCRVSINKFGKFRGRCVTTLKEGNVNVCSSVDPALFTKFVMNGFRKH